MRILNILSGLAVLLTTLAFAHLLAHLLQHHVLHATHEAGYSPALLAGLAFGVVVAILSLIGGCLLLRRGR